MDPIIEKVFTTEETARKLITDAKEKASSIAQEAAKKADEIISKAREESAALARGRIDKSREQQKTRIEKEKKLSTNTSKSITKTLQDQINESANQIADILSGKTTKEN